MHSIPLFSAEPHSARLKQISNKWGFTIRPPEIQDKFVLELSDGSLQLRKCDDPKFGSIYVDFCSGRSGHRRKYGGGTSEAIARAVGLKKGARPSVLDATAGMGSDAFVLASLGCHVHMIERSPIMAALLEDGLARAKLDVKIGPWVSQRLSLSFGDSREYFSYLPFKPDVVYLDPMFPEKGKSALVKKEMQVLKVLIGADNDADALLPVAFKVAKNRVVVKRPMQANYLAGKKPNTSIKSRNYRFDVYIKVTLA